MHACMHAYVQNTYIHRYIDTYIHTCICTCIKQAYHVSYNTVWPCSCLLKPLASQFASSLDSRSWQVQFKLICSSSPVLRTLMPTIGGWLRHINCHNIMAACLSVKTAGESERPDGIDVSLFTCTHIHIYIYIRTYIHTYILTCVYTYIYIYIYSGMSFTYTHIQIYV